jgi:predicted aspartyl protease
VRGALAGLLVVVLAGAGCTTGREAGEGTSPRAVLDEPTRVRIRIVQNITLVQATLNRVHPATLIVDTGAQSTIISPSTAKRLGLEVPTDAPRREVSVVGGSKLDMPFVKVGVVRVGGAKVEDMEVGVFDVAPTAKGIHGLLGADFLHRFRLTLDASEGVLQLEPLRH